MKESALLPDTFVSIDEIIEDYYAAVLSRFCSILVRKEVFAGRAKFGISGDGKELPQLALAKVFQKGDFRSGYYRDQTFVIATGGATWSQFFAELYGTTDLALEPHSGGRMMNAHFATRWLDEKGDWKNQSELANSAADLSPTAGQMPRALGLAYASKLYRNNPQLADFKSFSTHGNEVCFATIGDGATSEGMFFEAINAAGVLQVPLIVSIWDDGYGISVPTKYQTTKESISKVLAGFQQNSKELGCEILSVKAWNYESLIKTYKRAETLARQNHIPVIVHVQECTQPQGHSSSGSHERYKSKERLTYESIWDCNRKFREWILENDFATETQIETLEKQAEKEARLYQSDAWEKYKNPIKKELEEVLFLLEKIQEETEYQEFIAQKIQELQKKFNCIRRDLFEAVREILRKIRFEDLTSKAILIQWLTEKEAQGKKLYGSHLYSESAQSPLQIKATKPIYDKDSKMVDGRIIINTIFNFLLERDPRIFIIGEDVGKIGDVNQTLSGLQEKYGELRLTDTGIRETTILGQGIGAAMRGLRPIIEIQYFDYILYVMATLSDDLACLHYRSHGGQKAPVIIRTRGHRLEGVWHSGSPVSVILQGTRGIYICVPRNMVQAAGIYNTLLKGDNPAIVIESLNGYRLKEKMPSNLTELYIPLGIPDILKEGSDITVVTYGSMCRIAEEAALELEPLGIFLEVIDVQTLSPLDRNNTILESLQKTNRIIFVDEDMPGSTTAYMMQEIIDNRKGWKYLDSAPRCISAQPHRPPYGNDGDYFCKPHKETIIDIACEIMHETNPTKFPSYI